MTELDALKARITKLEEEQAKKQTELTELKDALKSLEKQEKVKVEKADADIDSMAPTVKNLTEIWNELKDSGVKITPEDTLPYGDLNGFKYKGDNLGFTDFGVLCYKDTLILERDGQVGFGRPIEEGRGLPSAEFINEVCEKLKEFRDKFMAWYSDYINRQTMQESTKDVNDYIIIDYKSAKGISVYVAKGVDFEKAQSIMADLMGEKCKKNIDILDHTFLTDGSGCIWYTDGVQENFKIIHLDKVTKIESENSSKKEGSVSKDQEPNQKEEDSENDSLTSDDEVINIWIEEFKKSGKTILEEISEVKAAIENESAWLRGSNSADEMMQHASNIRTLREYEGILIEF